MVAANSLSLCYYTDVDTATKVITGKSLWAANIAAMNDASEYRFGLETMRALLNDRNASGADPSMLDPATAVQEALDNLRLHMAPWYIICLSRQRDALNQWGFYAHEGGVCLELEFPPDVRFAASCARHDPLVELTPPGPPRQILYLRDDALLKKADGSIPALQEIEKRGLTVGKSDAILLKRDDFRLEDEWRLAFEVDEATNRDLIRERTRFGACVPYLDVHLASGAPLPIVSVTVGPSRGQRRVFTSLRDFLDRLDSSQTVACEPATYAARWAQCLSEWQRLASLRQASSVRPEDETTSTDEFIARCAVAQDDLTRLATLITGADKTRALHESFVTSHVNDLVTAYPDQADVANTCYVTRPGIIVWRSRIPYLFQG